MSYTTFIIICFIIIIIYFIYYYYYYYYLTFIHSDTKIYPACDIHVTSRIYFGVRTSTPLSIKFASHLWCAAAARSGD